MTVRGEYPMGGPGRSKTPRWLRAYEDLFYRRPVRPASEKHSAARPVVALASVLGLIASLGTAYAATGGFSQARSASTADTSATTPSSTSTTTASNDPPYYQSGGGDQPGRTPGDPMANDNPNCVSGFMTCGIYLGNNGPFIPKGYEGWSVQITSPANGTVVTGNTLFIGVKGTGFDMGPDVCYSPVSDPPPQDHPNAHFGMGEMWGGHPQQYWGDPASGHFPGAYHIHFDHALINQGCAPGFNFPMQNVKPGIHEIEVDPMSPDHGELVSRMVTVKIDYEPTNPEPMITADTNPSKDPSHPGVMILSPRPGERIPAGTKFFDVVLQFFNFNSSCGLMGKPDIPGWGHYHLMLDGLNRPSMPAMGCTEVFKLSTVGLQPGMEHTLVAVLTDNGHAPLMQMPLKGCPSMETPSGCQGIPGSNSMAPITPDTQPMPAYMVDFTIG